MHNIYSIFVLKAVLRLVGFSTATNTCHCSVYYLKIKPLEEYYRKQKKLLVFEVAGGPAETWQGLLAALHLQHMMSAVGSTQLSAGC